MERCQEAGCSAAARVWEDDWELSNNGQVQFSECACPPVHVCVCASRIHTFSKAASPTTGSHLGASPYLAKQVLMKFCFNSIECVT